MRTCICNTQHSKKTFKYVEDGVLLGFAVIRQCLNGWKVCPLFAENYAVAESLYKACLSSIPAGETLYLDIPMCNPEAVKLVQNFGGESIAIGAGRW